MKSVPKLIRRLVGVLLFSSIALLALNVLIFAGVTLSRMPGDSPWKTAEQAAQSLKQTQNGYALPGQMQAKLDASGAWAIFIDNTTHTVAWQTQNLPAAIPQQYTLSDIARLTRGYLNDYPTFTGESQQGLLVLGYPQKSYWKHMWSSWDYDFIAHLPRTLAVAAVINIAFIGLVYVAANTTLLRSVGPITTGIYTLSTGEPVHVKEKGLLSEIAANINRTAQVLQSQNYRLRKKETARANWIAGVSHDIRTPLSMVMGYAGQLQNDAQLTGEGQKKAAVIVKQSERMRDLINDLNLASKLEYNMQPMNRQPANVVAVVRQVVVNFINMDVGAQYPIEWPSEAGVCPCIAPVDKSLLTRAVANLIQNCMNHNPGGCTIYAGVATRQNACVICVEDDGVGVPSEGIKALNNAPHSMFCDDATAGQRHGLGLLIVRQIAASHGGKAVIEQSGHGGLAVKIILPLE